MADPLSADAFLAALRGEGVKVVEVDGWRSRNRDHKGKWGPVNGVMIHHTVTRGTAATVKLCVEGHGDLPGPLCHAVIAKDGTVHVIGYGRANHAGLGDPAVLDAVVAESGLPANKENVTDGNRHFYGFECENMGDGKDPWPAAQVDAIVRVAAGLCRAHGWGTTGTTSVIGHAEWQVGKIDPKGPGITMDAVRKEVAARLKAPAAKEPPKPPAPAGPPTYTVREGETLGWIAEAYGTTVAELQKLNPDIKDPDKLAVDQKVKLPG